MSSAMIQQQIRFRLIELGRTNRGDRENFRLQMARTTRVLLPVAHQLNAWVADLFDPANALCMPLPDSYAEGQYLFCQLWRERKIMEAFEVASQIKVRIGFSGGQGTDDLPLTVSQRRTLYALCYATSLDPLLANADGDVFVLSNVVPICWAISEIMMAHRVAIDTPGTGIVKTVAERMVASMDRWLSMAQLL